MTFELCAATPSSQRWMIATSAATTTAAPTNIGSNFSHRWYWCTFPTVFRFYRIYIESTFAVSGCHLSLPHSFPWRYVQCCHHNHRMCDWQTALLNLYANAHTHWTLTRSELTISELLMPFWFHLIYIAFTIFVNHDDSAWRVFASPSLPLLPRCHRNTNIIICIVIVCCREFSSYLWLKMRK